MTILFNHSHGKLTKHQWRRSLGVTGTWGQLTPSVTGRNQGYISDLQ